MRMFVSKKKIMAGATLGVLSVGSIAGYAFWTTTGSGSSSAVAATSNGTIVLHAAVPAGLFPGDLNVAVPYTADNLGASDLKVGTVSAVVSIDAVHVTAGCLASDFSVAPVAEDQVIPAGQSGVALAHAGAISFVNSASNQDGCKGATVTLTLSSN